MKKQMIHLFFNYKSDLCHFVFPNKQINNANNRNSFLRDKSKRKYIFLNKTENKDISYVPTLIIVWNAH